MGAIKLCTELGKYSMSLRGMFSDNCSDICPECDKHTGAFAYTYEFNSVFTYCPACGAVLLSGYREGKFVWRIVRKQPAEVKHDGETPVQTRKPARHRQRG